MRLVLQKVLSGAGADIVNKVIFVVQIGNKVGCHLRIHNHSSMGERLIFKQMVSRFKTFLILKPKTIKILQGLRVAQAAVTDHWP